MTTEFLYQFFVLLWTIKYAVTSFRTAAECQSVSQSVTRCCCFRFVSSFRFSCLLRCCCQFSFMFANLSIFDRWATNTHDFSFDIQTVGSDDSQRQRLASIWKLTAFTNIFFSLLSAVRITFWCGRRAGTADWWYTYSIEWRRADRHFIYKFVVMSRVL